jgi:anti-sigma regulatory factor (Ser/Thr protein kinase)
MLTIGQEKQGAMTAIEERHGARTERGFRHEALLYAGEDGFLDGTLPFILAAVAAEEPILVVVGAAKIERLRAELGADADHVIFADMSLVGTNPARIIPAWREFVSAHAASSRLRGIGEPIWAGRSPAELVECQRHEALLNLAFAGTADFWLLCPYDTDALDAAVIEKSHHGHPVVVQDGAQRESSRYLGLAAVAAPFADPLPDPPPGAAELAYQEATLSVVRALVAARAAAAGLDDLRAGDLVLAVNELATNSVRHAGGHGVLRVWQDDGALICEVRDGGRIDQPLAGRERPPSGQPGGHGLWLVNQLCDLVQVRSFAHGSAVRLHMRRG